MVFDFPMDDFSFSHLSSVEFEEFCFDLLSSVGAEKMSWRKGTGLRASPADQGRDIECYFQKQEPDGVKREERWFIECKHHQQGVSPGDLEGALAWALCERPDVLLVIASNAFSNPCKAYLQNYTLQNKPLFRIKIWEYKDLEKLTIGKPELLRKYRMADDFPFLKLYHPAHIQFLREPPLNSFKYFFAILEKAGPDRFREALSFAYMLVIKPDVEIPTDGNQTLGELLRSPVSYVQFREKCWALSHLVEQSFLIRAIVHEGLTSAFRSGDKTNTDRVVKNNKRLIDKLEEDVKTSKTNVANQQHISAIRERIDQIPVRIERGYQDYVRFCEEIVAPLFSEEIEMSPEFLAASEKMIGKKIIPLKKNKSL